MKRFVALSLIMGLMIGATAMVGTAQAAKVIKIAGMKAEGEPETIGMHKFGEYLEKLPGVNLSRARFENVMKQAQLERIASLCRFEKLIGESLYKYFITKNEIETVIYCAQHLDTDVIADLFTVPEFFRKEQTVFGETLQEARSFSDLAE